MIINLTTGSKLVEQLHMADKFWKRFTGLMTFKTLGEYEGLLLTPCRDIHTCFMKFPIDVICLSTNLTVLEVHEDIQPWRFIMCCKGTVFVLEVSAGMATNIKKGHRLKIVG